MHRIVRRSLIVTTALALIATVLPVQAQQQTVELMRIATDTQISATEGRQIQIGRAPTRDLQGQTCTVKATAYNDTSIHPGSRLSVFIGSNEIVLDNVEREPLATTSAEQTLIMQNHISVNLTMGSDERFSAGLDVSATCGEPEEVCEYNDQLLASDANCFEPCRYNEQIAADDNDCKPPISSAQGEQTPADGNSNTNQDNRATVGKTENLPTTGPTSSLLMVLSAGGLTFAAAKRYQRR